MKKFAMLVLALSLSGFTVGCSSETPKKPATPAADAKKMDETKPADAATPPAEEKK